MIGMNLFYVLIVVMYMLFVFILLYIICDLEVRNLFVIYFLNSVVKIVWYFVISLLFLKFMLYIIVYFRKYCFLVMLI